MNFPNLPRPLETQNWQPSHASQALAWKAVKATEPVVHQVFEVQLRGPLDTALLLRALDASSLPLRHVFEMAANGPLSAICHGEPHKLIDLADSTDATQAYASERQRRATQQFDVSQRTCDSALFRLSEDHYIWLVVLHPLVGDARTGELLWDLVVAHYKGRPAPRLPSLEEQRRAHQQYLNGNDFATDTAFFEPRLARTIESHRFYNGVPDSSGAPRLIQRNYELNEASRYSLNERLKDPSLTGFENVSAIDIFFQVVLLATLRRTGGNRSQAFGVALRATPLQGEPSPSLCLGNFTLWAAQQLELDKADSFANLASRVGAAATELCAHRQAHLPEPVRGDAPHYEATFTSTSAPEALSSSISTVSKSTTSHHYQGIASSAEVRVSAVAVNLSGADDGAPTRLRLDFDSQRFSERDADRWMDHFCRTLDSAFAHWSTPLETAPWMATDEQEALLALNPRPSPVGPDVVEGFEAHAQRTPERLALRFSGRNVSYGELNQRANRLAQALKDKGIGAGDWVAVALERGVDLVATLLACLKLGAAYVPLDPAHPVTRNALVLDVAKPKALIAEPNPTTDLGGVARCPVFFAEQLLAQAPDRPENPAALDKLETRTAYVIFTSGSTGKPKGVQVPRGALANFLSSMQCSPGFTADDALLSVTTISFDIAVLEIFLPLVSGGWLELLDRLGALNPKLLMSRLDSGEFTILQATPATWRMLIESQWQGTSTLKALCGGEALPPALAADLCARTGELWNMYGPTETTIWSTLERVLPTKKGVSIGRPIANTQVYLLDEHVGLVPQGVVGELVIGGLGVSQGYAGLAELTAEKFLKDPFSDAPDARMYRTGDLGRWLDDGTLECLGRVDFQVKIRGFRIELGEIETAIAKQGSLPEAIVVAREVTPGDPQLIAYGKSTEGFDAGVLRDYLKECLPAYMVPPFFVPLLQWPLTANGKIDRKALPAPQTEHRAAHESNDEPPATDLERRIANIWRNTLKTPSIGRNQDLFATGGSSLDAIRLLTALSELPEGEVALGTFLQNPTVCGIAEALQDPTDADEAVLVSLNGIVPSETAPALFCICGIHLYSELATALPDSPVYGVYLPVERRLMGLDDSKMEQEMPSLEQVATEYVNAIVEHQPQGPYQLAGVSFGGVLAFEIAQQLQAQNREVSLLALFDSLLSEASHFHRGAWFTGHLRNARKRGPRYVLNHPAVERRISSIPILGNTAKRWLSSNATNGSADTTADATATDTQIEQLREEQLRVYDLLVKDYEPRLRQHPGDALFFRATQDEVFPGHKIDSDGGWAQWVQGKLAVHEVPGTHLGILKDRAVRMIAGVLQQVIRPPC